MKYLGVIFTSSRSFKISTEHSRRAFHRAADAIFGCVGRVATEEVVLQLLLSKCVPILLYGLEACPLRKADLNVIIIIIIIYLLKDDTIKTSKDNSKTSRTTRRINTHLQNALKYN